MAKMPPEHRENVIYIGPDCRVYVNRPELRRDVRLLERVRGNLYRTSSGEEVILPADEEPVPSPGEEATPDEDQIEPYAVGNCNDPQIGPYRRLRTKLGTKTVPYSMIRSYVWLPSAAAGQIKTGTGEAAHIYSGGYPATGIYSVDAGLFHQMPPKDNWSVFMKIRDLEKPCIQPSAFIDKRFRPSQRVEFLVYNLDNDRVTVAVNGLLMDVTRQWITCTKAIPGWRKDGVGNRYKRITSIAQTGTFNPRSGAFFHDAEWDNVVIGNYGGSWHVWSSTDTNQNCIWPDTAKVYVDFRSFEREYIHINLPK